MTVTMLFEDSRVGLCEKCTRLLPLTASGWTPEGSDVERKVWLCSRDWVEVDRVPDVAEWLPVRPDGWTPFPSLAVEAEPVVRQVARFLCPFCRRGHAKRAAAVEHIARCWSNPGIRGCKTCAFYQPAYAAPATYWCEPGHQCSCNDYDEACLHVDGPEELKEPIAGCPWWRDRDEEEDEPAEDEWVAGLRELADGGAA